jgi:hypothetical protein
VPATVPRRDLETTAESSVDRVASAGSSLAQTEPEITPITFSPDFSAPPLDASLKVPLRSAADSLSDSGLAEPPVARAESNVVASFPEPVTSAFPIPAVATAPMITQPIVTPPIVTPPIVTPPIVTPPIVTPPIVTPPIVTSPNLEPADAVAPAAVPEAMLRVQKCATCGFPVSEGRTLCLDCEKKDREKKELERTPRDLELEREKDKSQSNQSTSAPAGAEQASDLAPVEGAQPEFVPAFLANAKPAQESWLADHVNLLAIVVLILGILVAVVVFR